MCVSTSLHAQPQLLGHLFPPYLLKIKLNERCSGTPHMSDRWDSTFRQNNKAVCNRNPQHDPNNVMMKTKLKRIISWKSPFCVHCSSGSSQVAENWRRDDSCFYLFWYLSFFFPFDLIRCGLFVLCSQTGFKKQPNPREWVLREAAQ